MPLLRRKYLFWAILICIIGFVLPFLFKAKTDSYNSVISLSFTVLGTLITIVTLIIAFLVYDKFGINAKFKEKQVDTVIELSVLLKKTSMTVSASELNYLVHATQSSETIRNSIPAYKADSSKTILVPGNFSHLIGNLNSLRLSYWLPEEIKNKMKFLDIYALAVVNDPYNEEYVRLDFNNSSNNVWMKTFPRLTFEMFNINLHNLFKEINIWFEAHSNISPNFNFFNDKN
ncbi:MAG: hypothetical protein NVSMB45_16450 [Ginsengibacter sp.]